MTSDIRSAAAQVLEAEPCYEEHGVLRVEDGDWQAARKVAESVLAESRPDDGDPLSEKWLESVMRPSAVAGYIADIPVGGFLRIRWNIGSSQYEAIAIYSHIANVSTRGDVRRLCRALGIELKEKP